MRAFSLEWLRHRRTQLDSASGRLESLRAFIDKTGLMGEDCEGKIVLDVGCGTGRFMELALLAGGWVVGVDMSRAVEAAKENVGASPRSNIIRADLLALPLKPASFDIVYSIGVLHHTPDTSVAFRAIVQYLKPGGLIAIWVYADEPRAVWLYNRISEVYRIVTTRLPLGFLYRLCWLAVPLYYLHQIPLLGRVLRMALPISGHPLDRWRHLDTFDWYAPRYQSKHRWSEVEGWFRNVGLVDIERLGMPVAVRGRRPC